MVWSLNALASVLGCNIGRLPMIYLGMPLGSHFKDPSIWNPIIEKNGEEAIWLETSLFV